MKRAKVLLMVALFLAASVAGSTAGNSGNGKGAVKVDLVAKDGGDVAGFVVLNLNAKRTLIANVQLKDGEDEETYTVVVKLLGHTGNVPVGELETDEEGEGGANVHVDASVETGATVQVNVKLGLPNEEGGLDIKYITGAQTLTFKK